MFVHFYTFPHPRASYGILHQHVKLTCIECLLHQGTWHVLEVAGTQQMAIESIMVSSGGMDKSSLNQMIQVWYPPGLCMCRADRAEFDSW